MFKQRSRQEELLDQAFIPNLALYRNLKELDTINDLLGGYTITLNALKKVIKKNQSYTLVDIGCGGGDTLGVIYKWGVRNGYDLQLNGIDLKQGCIDYGIANRATDAIRFICDDYKNMHKHLAEIDVIHASLFCHHFSDNEIIELIKYAQSNKAILIINDLQRNRIAYYAIKLLTLLFSKSYLVKNDAPLSVLRGFKRNDWLNILKQSDVSNYSINYKWAFRYEILIYVNPQ